MKNGRKSLPISVIPSKNTNSRMVARIFGKIRSFFSEKFHEKFLATQIFALLIILGTFGVFFSLYASNANRNRPFTFQGQLFTNENLPVADNTPIPIKFAIYSVVSGNANISCLWGTGTSASPVNNCPSTNSYTADAQFKSLSVTPIRGIFTVEMGDTSLTNMPAIPLDFQTGDYFLQVVVNGEALSPRTRITATPYAFNTQEVAGFAISGDISGTPTLSGSYLSFGTGIFTDSSTANGGTVTNMAFHSFLQKTLSATNTSITTSNAYSLYLEGAPLRGLNETITNAIALGVNATSTTSGAGTGVTNSYGLYVNAQTGATNNYAATFLGGSIGIGTATPSYMLDVATSSVGVLGVMRLQNSATAQMGNGAQLLFAANRTTSGMTNVAGIAGIITGIPDGAYRGALALYTASSTEPVERMRIDYLGNVGIGTTSPITQLHVPGKTPSTETGSITLNFSGPKKIIVQKNYAYVATGAGAGCGARIFDISNPASPTQIGSIDTSAWGCPRSIAVKGNYFYSVDAADATLRIYDISNPASPTSTGSVSLSGGGYSFSIDIQGRYAYVGTTGNSLRVVDVSNPKNPVQLANVNPGGRPDDAVIRGRYVYMTLQNGSTLKIYDVSDPASPVSIGSVGTGIGGDVLESSDGSGDSLAIQGRYVYIANHTASQLQIFDISSPTSPVAPSGGNAGVLSITGEPHSISVQGRYAYVASGPLQGAGTLSIVDISDPATPTLVNTTTIGEGPTSIQVQGRYAYLVHNAFNVNTDKFQVFDLGGGYIQQLEVGGLEVASMNVQKNLSINNGLSISGGVNVGSGGIYSTGSLAISASHASAIQIAPYGTGAGNTGELRFSELSANGNNYIGLKAPDSITTSTVWALPNADGTSGQVIKTNGSSILSWTTISAGTTIWNTVSGGIYYSAGKIGAGTSTAPTALLTLTGGGIMMDGVSQIQQWNSSVPLANTTTIADSVGDVGRNESITIGVDGLPIVAYRDASNLDLKVFKCSTLPCSTGTATTVDSTDDVGYDTSITIGTDGFPVISYHDSTNGDLKVLKCGNAACTSGSTVTSVDTTGSVGTATSITIGTDGFPIISYYDTTNTDLKVLKCGNAACTSGSTVTSVDTTGSVGSYTSIAIATDGLPVIAYIDGGNGDLKIVKCGNAACDTSNTITSVDTTGDVGHYPSITIGIDGFPIVAYFDNTNLDLKTYKCTSATCAAGTTTSIDTANDVGRHASITIGIDGLPIIAHNDWTNFDARLTKCGNTACSSGNTSISFDTTGVIGSFTALVIGVDGLPVVSYIDNNNLDLKITHCGNERCIPYWTRR